MGPSFTLGRERRGPGSSINPWDCRRTKRFKDRAGRQEHCGHGEHPPGNTARGSSGTRGAWQSRVRTPTPAPRSSGGTDTVSDRRVQPPWRNTAHICRSDARHPPATWGGGGGSWTLANLAGCQEETGPLRDPTGGEGGARRFHCERGAETQRLFLLSRRQLSLDCPARLLWLKKHELPAFETVITGFSCHVNAV